MVICRPYPALRDPDAVVVTPLPSSGIRLPYPPERQERSSTNLIPPDDFGKLLTPLPCRGSGPIRGIAICRRCENEIISSRPPPRLETPRQLPRISPPLKNKRTISQHWPNRNLDYIFPSQLQFRHRLFDWACRVTRDIATKILESEPRKDPSARGFCRQTTIV